MSSSQPSSLSEALAWQAAARPDATAFIYLEDGEAREVCVTFGELHRRARSLSAHLATTARPGDRILLVLPPGLGYITGVFGCLLAGAVAVPVYPPDLASIEQSFTVIKAVADDAQIGAVLTIGPLKPLLERLLGQGRPVTVLALDQLDLGTTPHEPPAPATDADSLAVLLYTSGSTGAPKGVMLSHGNFLHNARITVEEYGLAPGDVLCTWVPPYHVSGLFSGIFLPVCFGGCNVSFSPLHFLESPVRWLKAITRYRAIGSGCPTFAYDLCCATVTTEEIAALDLRSWRVSLVGGEPVRKDSLERFAARFTPAGLPPGALSPMYGLTESTMICTAGVLAGAPEVDRLDRAALQENRATAAAPSDEAPLFMVSSGHALGDLDVRVVDPDSGRPLAEDRIGEVWVAGPSVAKGYWNRPEESAATFGAHLVTETDPSPMAYLRTGDLGYLRDGRLVITGRLKELIIVRGLKYYPEDIERTVALADPAMSRAAIAAFACEQGGEELLFVAVELAASDNTESDAAQKEVLAATLRRAIARRLGVTVHGFLFVGPREIPRTRTGKIQRRACAARVTGGQWTPVALQQVARPEEIAALPMGGETRESLLAASAEERRARLTALLMGELAAVLGHAPHDAAQALTPDRAISELGLDSIMRVTLSSRLRRRLGCTLPIARLFSELQLDQLVVALLAELEGQSAAPEAVDFLAEARLDPSIAPLAEDASPRRAGTPEVVLLTGGTGFLGAALLENLLTLTDATIHCLVRATSPDEGKRRLAAALSRDGAAIPAAFASRVIAVPGELTRPGFGLSDEALARLGHVVDAIYHNGASVNFVASYEMLKAANVDAVVEVLKLACRGRRKAVHFVSSLAVFNSTERHGREILRESDRFADPTRLFGAYAQTKWVAEALLRQGSERGIAVTVHRPGFIAGDSRTGFTATEDFLSRFLKGGIQLGALPALPVSLDLVPVDYVAEAVVRLSRSPGAAGKVFHYRNPAPLPYSALLRFLAESGRPVEAAPVARFIGELCAAMPTDNALYPLLPFLTESMSGDGATFLEIFAREQGPQIDCENTTLGLAGTGLSCPPVGGELLSAYFGFFERSGFLERSRSVVS